MDRLFWPDPQFMSVAGPEEPWVVDLRGRAEEVLEAAIVPLRVSSADVLMHIPLRTNMICTLTNFTSMASWGVR